MEAVAAGDHVALELMRFALVAEVDAGPVGLQLVHGNVLDLEQERLARLEPRADQVLDDLRLPVDDDRLAGQRREVDPMALAVELQLDAPVDDPLALHTHADAGVAEEVGGALLQHPRANAMLDVLAAPVLEDDRVDALEVEQVRERQAGRAGADDPDLRAHQSPVRRASSSARCATWNAALAAGTPQ